MVGRSTGPQHESRHWHHVFRCHLHAISHKNGLDEAIQIINFVKSWSLNTCFFLIFHVIKRKAYIKHFCYDRYCDCLKEKYFCDWVASWTICFSMEYHFYLKEWLIRHFTEKEQSEPVTSSICCQWFFKVLVYYQRKMSTVIWKCS